MLLDIAFLILGTNVRFGVEAILRLVLGIGETRDALSRAKARGVKLGAPNLADARRAAAATIETNADRHAASFLPIIWEIQRAGAASPRAIAEALNARGIATARGR